MKKKKVNIEVPKQKERHIVSWSQQEDEILREQIRAHGTANWTLIASNFKDKTTRQCRRRWFTYLNSDFKKGGWSPEEDKLLREAQKIFGNRWTEIAKVVSGRTDNAVKNRFATLCKKSAKHKALAKENSQSSYTNLNNKRVMFPNGIISSEGGAEDTVPMKKMRIYNSSTTRSREETTLTGECGVEDHFLTPSFSAIAENLHGCDFNSHPHLLVSRMKEASIDGSKNDKVEGTFLDVKVEGSLMQQAEVENKVELHSTDPSLDNSWIVLEDVMRRNKGSEIVEFRNRDVDTQWEDLKSSNEGSRPWKEHDVYESSPARSEYSTGSTEHIHDEYFWSTSHQVNILTCCDEMKAKHHVHGVIEYSNAEFKSPLFRAVAAAIPSPEFSESEKHFLMKTLGMDSNLPSPACKRSLLHWL